MTCTSDSHALLKLDRESWSRLRCIGTQDDGDGGMLELRQCPECSSSLAVQMPTVERAREELATVMGRVG